MCECNKIEFGDCSNMITIETPTHVKVWYIERNIKLTNIPDYPNTIQIDPCILSEIKELWNLGIVTTGCCCGHNKQEGFVGVRDEDIEKMIELGYKIKLNENDLSRRDSFKLKNK